MLIGCCARGDRRDLSWLLCLAVERQKHYCQPENWVQYVYRPGVFICKARDFTVGRAASWVLFACVSACPASLSPADSHCLSSCWGILEWPGKVATNTEFDKNAYSALAESALVLHFISLGCWQSLYPPEAELPFRTPWQGGIVCLLSSSKFLSLNSGLRLAEQLGRREDEAKIRHGLGLSLWASGNLEEAQHQVSRRTHFWVDFVSRNVEDLEITILTVMTFVRRCWLILLGWHARYLACFSLDMLNHSKDLSTCLISQ